MPKRKALSVVSAIDRGIKGGPIRKILESLTMEGFVIVPEKLLLKILAEIRLCGYPGSGNLADRMERKMVAYIPSEPNNGAA